MTFAFDCVRLLVRATYLLPNGLKGSSVMVDRTRIGLREVRALGLQEEVWDSDVPGFGVRRQTGPGVSYILLFRTAEGRQRRHTIGRHGKPWTPDTARKEALRLLGEVVKGTDPAADKKTKRQAPTVNDLLDDYWKVAEAGTLMTRRRAPKKASTLLSDKGRIDKHIRPILGALKVASVTTKDVESLMRDIIAGRTAAKKPTGKKRGVSNVRGGRGVATRTIGLLGAIFTYAVKVGMRKDNPVHGIVRPADGRKERRLSDTEYQALGKALRVATDTVWPAAVAATNFLLLTGWRSGEALTLRWQDLDLSRRTATLPDTKTGKSVRPLSGAARDVLRGLSSDGDRVFPATRGEGLMTGFPSLFRRIAKLGELPADITPHVLRHSFASLAGDMGFSEATIATLLGHRQNTVTSRYVHAADAVLLAAADAVANETLARTGDAPKGAEIVPLRRAGAVT
jgi:integrase